MQANEDRSGNGGTSINNEYAANENRQEQPVRDIETCCSRAGLLHPTDSSGIVARLQEEFRLAKSQLLLILFYLFWCYFGASCVFTNSAFYRYPTDVNLGMRLKDLGFEIIPEIDLKNKEKVELFNMLVQIFTCTAIILASLFGNTPGRTKPHLVNMTRRIMEM